MFAGDGGWGGVNPAGLIVGRRAERRGVETPCREPRGGRFENFIYWISAFKRRQARRGQRGIICFNYRTGGFDFFVGAHLDISCIQGLIDILPQGAVVHAPDGQIVAANTSACDLLGLSLDVLLGRDSIDPRWQALHPDGTAFAGTGHPAMLAIETGLPVPPTPMGVFIPDAGITWLSVSAAPLKWSEDPACCGSVALFVRQNSALHHFDPSKLDEIPRLNIYQFMKLHFTRLRVSVMALERAAPMENLGEIVATSQVSLQALHQIDRWVRAYEAATIANESLATSQDDLVARMTRAHAQSTQITFNLGASDHPDVIGRLSFAATMIDIMSALLGPADSIALSDHASRDGSVAGIKVATSYEHIYCENYFKGNLNEIAAGLRTAFREQLCLHEILSYLIDRHNASIYFENDNRFVSAIILQAR